TSVVIDEAPGPMPIWLTLLTSIFMHGGWLHIGGNMLFLFIFGDNIEKAYGHIKYLVFYLVCGIIASLAHVLSQPDSIIPSLGASGAISGVLAAYLVLFPTNRVKVLLTLGVIFLRPIMVPAVVMIGLWALLQFVNGLGAIAVSEQTSGVAYWAHIGGFIAGALITLLAKPFLDRGVGRAGVTGADEDRGPHVGDRRIVGWAAGRDVARELGFELRDRSWREDDDLARRGRLRLGLWRGAKTGTREELRGVDDVR